MLLANSSKKGLRLMKFFFLQDELIQEYKVVKCFFTDDIGIVGMIDW